MFYLMMLVFRYSLAAGRVAVVGWELTACDRLEMEIGLPSMAGLRRMAGGAGQCEPVGVSQDSAGLRWIEPGAGVSEGREKGRACSGMREEPGRGQNG